MSMISKQVESLRINAKDNWDEKVAKMLFDAADTIEDLTAKVRANNLHDGWIPVDDKLPNYKELVDITTRDLRVKIGWREAIKEDGMDDFWCLPLDDATCAMWNVIAWKPRPEPYKEDGE